MSNKIFQITGLGPDGKVLLNEKTAESYAISELQMYIDNAKIDLWTGKLKQIIIEEV